MTEELITLEEAAGRLGVHVTTLRRWTREGAVPAYRLGRRFVRVAEKEKEKHRFNHYG